MADRLMQRFTTHRGLVATLDRSNVDTDQIIPKQFLKRIERSGFGQFLFFDWRFFESGEPNPSFELNRPEFQGATILVTRDNFGSGSSREHAVWALQDYGFRAILAPSFADIFYNNCFQNGVLPIRLPPYWIDRLFQLSQQGPLWLTVDLAEQEVRDEAGLQIQFDIDPSRKERLWLGLDDIDRTLLLEDRIRAYERTHPLPPLNTS